MVPITEDLTVLMSFVIKLLADRPEDITPASIAALRRAFIDIAPALSWQAEALPLPLETRPNLAAHWSAPVLAEIANSDPERRFIVAVYDSKWREWAQAGNHENRHFQVIRWRPLFAETNILDRLFK